jgi:hypothetical protein
MIKKMNPPKPFIAQKVDLALEEIGLKLKVT